jgi:hypothetical protein
MKSTVLFESRLTRLFYAGLVGALLVLALLGWLTDRAVLHVQRQGVEATLKTMLATSARAVTQWLDDRRDFAALLVRTRRMEEILEPILEGKSHDSRLLRVLLDD